MRVYLYLLFRGKWTNVKGIILFTHPDGAVDRSSYARLLSYCPYVFVNPIHSLVTLITCRSVLTNYIGKLSKNVRRQVAQQKRHVLSWT